MTDLIFLAAVYVAWAVVFAVLGRGADVGAVNTNPNDEENADG